MKAFDWFAVVAVAGFAGAVLLVSAFAPRVSTPPTSEPTAHQVFADARDTTVLTNLLPEYQVGDTLQRYSFRLSAYRRATYVQLFYYNTDGQRVYIPGAEYYALCK